MLTSRTEFYPWLNAVDKANLGIDPGRRYDLAVTLNAGVLTFKEFAMREPVPLATIHEAVLEFLRGRDDVVVFGATAVNAYVSEPRMTQDIDLVSPRAEELAEELREYVSERFHIAVRVRTIGQGKGHRLLQVQKAGHRHLVDVRRVDALPRAQRIEDVLVISPPELIAQKVLSYHRRKGQPKSFSDMRDLAMLFLAFPNLKRESGEVTQILQSMDANEDLMTAWRELVAQEISLPDGEDEFE